MPNRKKKSLWPEFHRKMVNSEINPKTLSEMLQMFGEFEKEHERSNSEIS